MATGVKRPGSTKKRPARRSKSAAPPAGLSAINKIVIVFQENHTFDNYFGTFPGADGTAGKTICLPEKKGASTPCVSPFHSPSLTPIDMSHNWTAGHADYDGMKMDGFVYAEGNRAAMCY